MSFEELAAAQLSQTIDALHFPWLGAHYAGKVRENYSRQGLRVLICSDRISCFDRILTTVPFKGQVLSELAMWWFDQTKNIAPNHLVASPDANVMIARECDVVPIEVVVRAYLTGSAWRDYEAGKDISGITLPRGMRPSEQLPEVLITPSTKAAHGAHDLPISESEIRGSNLVDISVWETMKRYALELFAYGQEEAAKHGLILVDTKYEFGILNKEVVLVDEIHTLDSSRYWVASSYKDRFESGTSPEMLDKEPVRQWLLTQGFKGDGAIPPISNDYRISLSRHYVDAFQRISGKHLTPQTGNLSARIEGNLRKYFAE